MAVLTVLMCFASTNVFAQLKEVRGVQTRVIAYQGEKEIGYENEGRNTIHGFEFKNENNYPVWIEVELCTNGFSTKYNREQIAAGTYDTKSFTLNAGETYVWKTGEKMIRYTGTYNQYYGNSGVNWSTHEYYDDYYDQYYVKYKAYKAE